MEIDQEQLEEITNMAQLFFPPEDIAINIGVDPEEFKTFLLAQSGPAYFAFKKGWLLGEIPLRKSIAQAAQNGSNPAQVKMLELKQDSEIKMNF